MPIKKSETMTYKQFIRAVQVRGQDFDGISPGGAGAELGVSRQRIWQLVDVGILRCLKVYDERGELLIALINTDDVRWRKRVRLDAVKKAGKVTA